MSNYYAILPSNYNNSDVTVVLGWTEAPSQDDANVYAGTGKIAIPLSIDKDDWENRPMSGATIQNGAIKFSAGASILTLAEKAQLDLQSANIYVSNNFSKLGKSVPGEWNTYVAQLTKIADGEDTSATELPSPPSQAE